MNQNKLEYKNVNSYFCLNVVEFLLTLDYYFNPTTENAS